MSWPGQRNGQISLSLMTLVLGYRMHPAAAVSFLAMRTALFLATGVWIGISDAYRSFAHQDQIFRARYTPGWPSGIRYAGSYWRKRAGVAAAAVPGYSNHGWALALDINNYGSTAGRVFRWLLDHAAAFGWSWTTGRNANEPWHWEYVGSLTRPAGHNYTEIDMPLTDADAQTVAKTQIILPQPWGQASIAETIAGTRSRTEDTYLMVSALTAAVGALAQGQGLNPDQLSSLVASKVDAALADDFSRVEALLSGAVSGLSDADAARLAKAVNDDAAARLRN